MLAWLKEVTKLTTSVDQIVPIYSLRQRTLFGLLDSGLGGPGGARKVIVTLVLTYREMEFPYFEALHRWPKTNLNKNVIKTNFSY